MTMHIFAQFLRNIEALERLELATNGRILSLRSSPAALHTSPSVRLSRPARSPDIKLRTYRVPAQAQRFSQDLSSVQRYPCPASFASGSFQ